MEQMDAAHTFGSLSPHPDWRVEEDSWLRRTTGFGLQAFHPGARRCIRAPAEGTVGGQQCCYDIDGALITDGAGAGTPDRYAGRHSLWSHQLLDAAPFFACGWESHLPFRPPDNRLGCRANFQPPRGDLADPVPPVPSARLGRFCYRSTWAMLLRGDGSVVCPEEPL